MNVVLHTACGKRIRRVLRLGAQSLDADARRSIRDFIRSRFNPEGGFRGRSSESDLYYTVFGLECAGALDLELPTQSIQAFLEKAAAKTQDFVHLTCLARCLELVGPDSNASLPEWRALVRSRMTPYACVEGGFHRHTSKRKGTVYESFLAMLACESLGDPFPAPDKMLHRLGELQQSSGGFVNDGGLGASTTPVTAAALGLLWELKQPPPARSVDWLLARLFSRGGFAAAPLVPMPDLLSTATALHALRAHNAIDRTRAEACMDFVTSLWDESGGFCGHALDRNADCEYTFYALLALGNLSAEAIP